MVAQIGGERLTHSSHAPEPDPADSDDILLALETARALEAHGDLRDAARWLRRAAEQAEEEGNDARVLVFARAAADLTNTIQPAPAAPLLSAPTPPPISARVTSPPRVPARLPPPRPSTPEDEPVTERTLPVTTMRVAIPLSTQEVTVFVVRKLETG